MPAIFISHSSRDNKVANDIKAWLGSLGFDQVFLDFDDDTGLVIGEDWEKRLYAEIARCHAVVLVLTPNWLASKWCFAELAQARGLGKVLLPVICEPLGDYKVLPQVQAADLIEWNPQGLHRIEQRLHAITDELARGFPLPADRPPYPGIHAFEAEDAAIYFGRDDETRRVIEKLEARRTVAGKAIALRGSSADAAKIRRSAAAAADCARPPDEDRLETAGVEHARQTIDQLATRYGRLFRSSSVSQYLIVIFGTWVSGIIGLTFKSLSGATIAVQFIANGLVLADAAFRARHRWQERWLEYRAIAERLRWYGLRCSFGLGLGPQDAFAVRRNTSWGDWYLQRFARALGPPRGKIDSEAVAAAADHLTDVEIPDQISYHRRTFRQLGILERRLSYAAHAALFASASVAVLLIIDAVRAGRLEAVGWKPIAVALLSVLPGTIIALNGLRVDADLIRLVERSAQTLVLLFRIRRVILAAPRDYDHVSANMQRLCSLMAGELAEWRFVIDSRRSRSRRPPTMKKRGRLLRALRKPNGAAAS